MSRPEGAQGKRTLKGLWQKVEGWGGLLLFQLGLEGMDVVSYLMYFYGRPGRHSVTSRLLWLWKEQVRTHERE